MYDKPTENIKFKPVKPIVATAKKVDTTPQGDDILRIEIPFDDDLKVVRDSLNLTSNDKEKPINEEKTINKEVNKESREIKEKVINREIKEIKEKLDRKEDDEMDERDVDKLLNKKITEMKYQEKFDKLGNKTDEISSNTSAISSKVDKISDELHESEDKINKGFIETCNGVDCIKKDVSELNTKISNLDLDKRFSEIDNKFSEINNKIEKFNTKEEEVLCTNCNSDIKVGSSYCPGCGAEIEGWEGLENWKNYSKRSKK